MRDQDDRRTSMEHGSRERVNALYNFQLWQQLCLQVVVSGASVQSWKPWI